MAKSSEGLDFWAGVNLQTIVGWTPVKAKAKAKGKAKQENTGAPAIPNLEKTLKGLIGSEISTSAELMKLEVKINEAPDNFTWAKK